MGLSFLCKTVTLHFRQIFCVMKCSSKILFTDFTFALVVPSLYHLEIHDQEAALGHLLSMLTPPYLWGRGAFEVFLPHEAH